MACFLVTTAAAVGVGVARHVVKHQEKKNAQKEEIVVNNDKLVNAKKLGYLELLLWGGSFILAGEHVLHGEITFRFPFLTAVTEGREATLTMLKEMGIVGTSMLVILVAAWFGGILLARYLKNKKNKAVTSEGK